MLELLILSMASAADFTPCLPPAAGAASTVDLALLETPLDEAAMREAAGGSAAAVDISQLGLNFSTTTGSVSNVSVVGSDTGGVANNVVSGNSGITAVFNNTGNGVVFQNTVQVNVFLGPGGQ
jgi:hypothetical protein